MANKQSAGNEVVLAAEAALKAFNEDYNMSWDFGQNWNTSDTPELRETFIYKYFFPKISQTMVIDTALGNRFNWLAKEDPFVGQYDEEYVILDTVPIAMNLSKNEELLLKRNYPRVATKLFHEGIAKKVKFTLNDNDFRLNFGSLNDLVSYANAVYKKALSDINVNEEYEMKAMTIDYALNHVKERRTAQDMDELFEEITHALLNIQNNSAKYNEADTASGGAIGRYTTVTRLEDVMIFTNDLVKARLLDSKIANLFQVKGIDFTKKIMSFDDLGGVYKATEEFQITSQDTINKFRAMGDYQISIGDTIFVGEVFTFDVSALTEFVGKVVELKPESEIFALIIDINAYRYRRYTRDMYRVFENGEFKETNNWLHYYSRKNISPFYNKIVITQGEVVEEPTKVLVVNTTEDPVVASVTGNVSANITNTTTNPVNTKEVVTPSSGGGN